MPLPLLLEFGCEEIPAAMLNALAGRLASGLETELRGAMLWSDAARRSSVWTPRRLACHVDALLERQNDREEEVVGPPAKAAYDAAGKPTRAAEQFAARFGLTPEKLYRVRQPKGEYVALKHAIAGQAAAELLPDCIMRAWKAVAAPRAMRWDESGLEFIRPLRWMVALLGDAVVPLRLGAVEAGRETRGHRTLGKPAISLPTAGWEHYLAALKENFVLAEPDARRRRIEAGLAASANGAQPRPDAALLDLLVNLTEFPTVVRGEFDAGFLDLPAEVLITVMRGHQHYFALEEAHGKLAPAFLAVANQDRDREGLIRHGNERVLRARFNDARFFWRHDRVKSLEARLEDLRHISFHAKLGNYQEKAWRMRALVQAIVPQLSHAGEYFEQVSQAAMLAKCDLGTDLVKEFTELQGQIGGLLARAEGLPATVADAIYEHYLPLSSEGEIPSTPAGSMVALADKLDTIVGMFGLGEIPSGSRDPYALRRQANGIARILIEHELPLDLNAMIQVSAQLYAEAGYMAWKRPKNEAVLDFLRERQGFIFQEVKGYPGEEVRAVLDNPNAHHAGAPWHNWQKLRAVHETRERYPEKFARTAEALKRMRNIVEQAGGLAQWLRPEWNPKFFNLEEEVQLQQAIEPLVEGIELAQDREAYAEALDGIAALAEPLENYFQKVRVNDPDTELRENRLRFLAWATTGLAGIADLSQIAV